jgi:two-component system chemotaxis sensor kinase CheA
MSFEADEEILQDFLVEAGEILESLSEELVELENDIDNADLLNSIFRGFHTVKGGAGFLSLADLVDVCHGAENIFDLLRTGKRSVNSELMDTILSALDTVNDMFVLVQNKEPLTPANPNLLAELERLSLPEEVTVVDEPGLVSAVDTPEDTAIESESNDEMSEDEFERLLDELHGSGSVSSSPTITSDKPSEIDNNSYSTSNDGGSDEISDDEFESLLDELHGQGAFSVDVTDSNSPDVINTSDEIDDIEFEKLLDELHGKGNAPKALDDAVIVNPASEKQSKKNDIEQLQPTQKKIVSKKSSS